MSGLPGKKWHRSVHQTIEQNTKQYKQEKQKYGKQNKNTCTQTLALCKIALRCCKRSRPVPLLLEGWGASLKRLLLRLSPCITCGYRRFVSFSVVDHTCLPMSSTNCPVGVVIWRFSRLGSDLLNPTSYTIIQSHNKTITQARNQATTQSHNPTLTHKQSQCNTIIQLPTNNHTVTKSRN